MESDAKDRIEEVKATFEEKVSETTARVVDMEASIAPLGLPSAAIKERRKKLQMREMRRLFLHRTQKSRLVYPVKVFFWYNYSFILRLPQNR